MLCIAEKNSVANQIAQLLHTGQIIKHATSKYGQSYQFQCTINGRQEQFIVIHGAGHNKNYQYQKNENLQPIDFFTAKIESAILDTGRTLKKSVTEFANNIKMVIACQDNDREGEHIAYESVEIVSEVLKKELNIYPSRMLKTRRDHQKYIISSENQKRGIPVKRCRFSSLTKAELLHAFSNLDCINTNIVDAVDVRMQLDLRIGYAFSALQNRNKLKILRTYGDEQQVQKVRDKDKLKLTFGTCQIPTLGLCYNIPPNDDEDRAKLVLSLDNFDTKLTSDTNIYLLAVDQGVACNSELQKNRTVNISINDKETTVAPPHPLNTITLQKALSPMSADLVMKHAEDMYQKGIISYPRTETQVFVKEMNVMKILDQLKNVSRYAEYINKVCNTDQLKFNNHLSQIISKNQNNSKLSNDNSHPPIHPLKFNCENLNEGEQKVYDYIIRHFLASISYEAVILHRQYETKIANIQFTADTAYLKYPGWQEILYNKHADEIPENRLGSQITRTVNELYLQKINPPVNKSMTQLQLINLMDMYGIGTDATIAEHIRTIKEREYVDKQFNVMLAGKALCKMYQGFNYKLLSCMFRSVMEAGIREICENKLDCDKYYNDIINFSRDMFIKLQNHLLSIK